MWGNKKCRWQIVQRVTYFTLRTATATTNTPWFIDTRCNVKPQETGHLLRMLLARGGIAQKYDMCVGGTQQLYIQVPVRSSTSNRAEL